MRRRCAPGPPPAPQPPGVTAHQTPARAGAGQTRAGAPAPCTHKHTQAHTRQSRARTQAVRGRHALILTTRVHTGSGGVPHSRTFRHVPTASDTPFGVLAECSGGASGGCSLGKSPPLRGVCDRRAMQHTFTSPSTTAARVPCLQLDVWRAGRDTSTGAAACSPALEASQWDTSVGTPPSHQAQAACHCHL